MTNLFPTLCLAATLAASHPDTSALALGADSLAAAAAPGVSAPAPPPKPALEVRAERLDGPVTIDGSLSEPTWQEANAFEAFIQRDPVEGVAPSQRTEVRVRYDDDALYVGARLHDTSPGSIVSRLARRDASIASDRFAVYLDPYHDGRSGYFFMVNAAGTLYDGTLSNDVSKDDLWDGVWEGKARIDDQGWTAEMRIPWSQIRFLSSERPVWGINFMREIPRAREKDYAAYRPRKGTGFVSRFPDLVGLENIERGSAIELLPYVTAKGEYLHHDAGDPYNDGSRLYKNAGGDLRSRVGGMTLNATVNPDFGQVEVDPTVVNLTDVESFFEEKRPFFVDGASTFGFGREGAGDYWDYNWDDPLFFYSRRIGRQPQGEVPSSDFADVPAATPILGAAKLTGRLGPSWTLGTLQAVTDRVVAHFVNGDQSGSATIEPRSWYGALRTQREIDHRRSGIGFLGTGTAAALEGSGLQNQINSSSFMAGLDGWTPLGRGDTWVLSGWTAASRIQGSRERMLDVQSSSTHYFQRPDAHHVELDSSATFLSGVAGRYWINKQKGDVMFNTAVGFVSPGFDVNGLGIQDRSDLVNGHVAAGYRWNRANAWSTYRSVKAAIFGSQDYGSNVTKRGAQVDGFTEFRNGWTGNLYVTGNAQAVNNVRTRGGPLTLDLPLLAFGGDVQTDSQRNWYAFVSYGRTTSKSGSWYDAVYPVIAWKPTASFNLQIGPGWERLHEDAQYVTSFDDPAATATFGQQYVFATLEQKTASASLRLNWTFTPRLSLQTFVQPFVSSATYRDYKALARPESYTFTPTTYSENLDFTVRSLKGNSVLRWEYRPGSTLFLVWTQDRSSYEPIDDFSIHTDPLVKVTPENVFMVKLSYYFTP